MSNIRTVLFDLDGTLADTAPDLAAALNQTLADENRPPLPFAQIRPHVSHGSTALVRLGFGGEPDDRKFSERRARLLAHYANDVCRATRIFPGIADVLGGLHRREIGWGIVTNKPAFLTDPLVERLELIYPPACIVSGDTTKNRKPHPEPLLHACTIAGVAPEECLYIGDAERDIQAGRQAGMQTLVALFGYLSDDDVPAAWGADGMINHPSEILEWVDGN